MKKIKHSLSLVSLLVMSPFFTEASVPSTPPAFIGGYGLNIKNNLLDVLAGEYGVRNVNSGFLFIEKNSHCSYSNLTDGSGVHPIDGHLSEFSRYTDAGGKLGFVISGADGGEANVWDPIRRCSQPELEALLLDIVKFSPEVNQLSIDLESGSSGWQGGKYGKDLYDKIGLSIERLKMQHPDVEVDLTIPAYSSYWKGGYNQALKDFLSTYDDSIDYLVIMVGNGSLEVLSDSIEDSLNYLSETKREEVFALLYHTNAGNFDANELERAALDLGIEDFTVLVTYEGRLDVDNAELYRDMHGEEGTPTPPTNSGLIVQTMNQSLSTGVDVSYTKGGETLMHVGYVSPGSEIIAQDGSDYINTNKLIGTENVTVQFETWVGREVCPDTIDFNSNYDVIINVINPVNSDFSCTLIPR